MTPRNYHLNQHARRLLWLMEQPGEYDICPATDACGLGSNVQWHLAKKYKALSSKCYRYYLKPGPCRVCQNILGISGCPCGEFGKRNAAKLTWFWLEEHGWLGNGGEE